MRRKINTIHLNQHQIQELEKMCQSLGISKRHELIYEGHIPHAAYLLIDGDIFLAKRKKTFMRVPDHHVIGAEELMNNKAFKYSAIVQPGSKLLVLDRSSIQEILSDIEHAAHEALVTVLDVA